MLTPTKGEEMPKVNGLIKVGFKAQSGFKIDDEDKRIKLLQDVMVGDYKLIIFDALRDIHSLNENDSKETQRLIDYLREFTIRGITVLLAHHNRKESFLNPKDPQEVLRGSSALGGGIDSLLAVESKKIDAKTIEMVITQAKLREGAACEPFKIKMIEKENKMTFEYVGVVETETSKLEKTKDAVRNVLKDKKSENNIHQTLIIQLLVPQYYSERTIIRAIKEMKESKEIIPVKGEGRRIYLKLRE